MPTYVCSAAAGRLTPVQKAEIVRTITAIHHEETGAPRYGPGHLLRPCARQALRGRPTGARGSDIGSRRYSRRADQGAEEPDAPTDNAGRRQGQWRRHDAVWVYCVTFPQQMSPNTAASCCLPGRRTRCGKGSGPWPDKLQTVRTANACRQISPARRSI
jgi:hypothetical protein